MRLALATFLALLVVAGCAGRQRPDTAEGAVGYRQKGLASWYGPGFHGKRTANGEVYDMDALTAAHRELPFDVMVEVENLDNGRTVHVRINDRGPFVRGRVIDLSRAAARKIDMIGPGTARVRLRVIDGPRPIERYAEYWVQVGAFRDRGNAHALAADLERHFSSVRIRSADGWHRVGVGPFSKKRNADEMLGRLERRGFRGLIVGS